MSGTPDDLAHMAMASASSTVTANGLSMKTGFPAGAMASNCARWLRPSTDSSIMASQASATSSGDSTIRTPKSSRRRSVNRSTRE